MADITVIAIMQAKSGSDNDIREALKELVGPTRKEAGCVAYDLHESVTVPGAFVTIERWHGEEDLDSHMKTEHVQKALAAAGDLLDGPPAIHTLKPVDVA